MKKPYFIDSRREQERLRNKKVMTRRQMKRRIRSEKYIRKIEEEKRNQNRSQQHENNCAPVSCDYLFIYRLALAV